MPEEQNCSMDRMGSNGIGGKTSTRQKAETLGVANMTRDPKSPPPLFDHVRAADRDAGTLRLARRQLPELSARQYPKCRLPFSRWFDLIVEPDTICWEHPK